MLRITCATLCVSFSSKTKAINAFPKSVFDQNRKHVKARDQRTGTPAELLYRGRTGRESHRRCCIRKLFLKILQYSQETPVLEPILKKFADI